MISRGNEEPPKHTRKHSQQIRLLDEIISKKASRTKVISQMALMRTSTRLAFGIGFGGSRGVISSFLILYLIYGWVHTLQKKSIMT